MSKEVTEMIITKLSCSECHITLKLKKELETSKTTEFRQCENLREPTAVLLQLRKGHRHLYFLT